MPDLMGDGSVWLQICGLSRYNPVVVVSIYSGGVLAKYWLTT